MAKKRPRRYFWALHFAPGEPELLGLSSSARQGLAYASELAEHARERSLSALEPTALAALAPLTIEELARRDFLSPIQLRSQIKQARIELFGKDLRDSAIAYRLKKRRERGQRRCVEPECEELIPALANGRRRYCSAHGIPAARVRRHRYGVAGPARRPRPYRRGVASEDASFLADLSPAQWEKLERVIFAPPRAEPRPRKRV